MRHISRWSGALALLAASQGADAIYVNFDYSLDTSNFFAANPAAVAALEAAGQFFETRLTDTLDPIASGGVNHFNAIASNPATGLTTTFNDYSVAADTLVVFVGSRNLGGSLGLGGPGGFSASGTGSFLTTATTRGEGVTQNSGGDFAVDFAPWGGSISFNSASAWYFDADPSTLESFPGQNDFYSVALHELGHVLGFGTADSWDNLAGGGTFTGSNAMAANGGSPVPLANDAHWQEGLLSLFLNNPQEAAMDPTLTTGTRKHFTTLDMAALADIGWEVVPVPLPAAAWLFLSGMLALRGWRRTAA